MLYMCMYIIVLIASKSEKHTCAHIYLGEEIATMFYTHINGERNNYNVLDIQILT